VARPNRSAEIDTALLQAVAAHPHDLVGMVAAQLGLSTARISMQVRALVAEGYLDKTGTTRPTYTLGRNRRFERRYPREGLAEDTVWFEQLLPLLRDLPRNLLDIAHHGVTEMVNNAVDHSDAAHVTVRMDRHDDRLWFEIADDGIGIFRKITRALDLPDERLALLELSKGKLTTDPRRHSGEGIFFTSRMFDSFRIASEGLVFDHDADYDKDLLDDTDEAGGTRVAMQIATDSGRTVKEIIDQYSSGPEDYSFAKTVVPVRLAKVGDENLVSRSQAKRLLQRVDRFRCVVLDFADITTIGQAFADEIFRVFCNEHPEVELVAIHAVAEVQQMIRRAEVLRDEQGGQLSLLK
jgi:anti-sigma regulatory factor (Ser/Thr protein kinase)/predicted DNA-binding protein